MIRRIFPYLFIISCLFSVDYETQIQPIFNANCGNCHLGNSSGGVNLSSYENVINSDIVVPFDAEDSELYDRITRDNSDNGDMPPGNAELSEEQINLIVQIGLMKGRCQKRIQTFVMLYWEM